MQVSSDKITRISKSRLPEPVNKLLIAIPRNPLI